ncbi:CPBP family intramembrane glutamic endopeptidase [Massilia litorea]|uniref:CPBP family intramembrane metalloprotease n=1 Tax=Massilia litorea TaxID=2769491 RepID=A0A7L9U886_9BURK|nr:CPBP family intramembrane glutamic endopeptidase [Massilia litorea]QOL51060.1 CPBP family intramembrane metalloprotease [Massilia litorea]
MQRIDVKPFWRAVPFGIAGLTLAFVLTAIVVRAVAMFGPGSWRPLIVTSFLAMTALPWVVLGRAGRRQIGLQAPRHAGWLALGLLLGALTASVCHLLGASLYGTGPDNWFVSIARSYQLQPTQGWSLLRLHLTFTIAACLFSPVGEEIFFRGFLQKVLEDRHGRTRATVMEASLFALVHLCHHGIVASAAGYRLLPVSGALWVAQMFALSLMFAWLRRRSDSILPAIAAHAAFNAAMNGWIFARLWP